MTQISRDRAVLAGMGAVGCMALAGFIVVLLGIPWDWSMFMDDTLYNTWMPSVTDFRAALWNEITQYFALGRFYPVKYIANLLKWRYLPNDPYVFRYFNFAVYLVSIALGAAAAIKASRTKLSDVSRFSVFALFVFLIGSSFLHKPLLETISLNPLGETWVCFFFALGSLFLFQESWTYKHVLSRVCFLLVALSKEPAALVFFAMSAHYAAQAWLEPESRKKWTIYAAVDFSIFVILLGLALSVMAQGVFTKGAYFPATPWLAYSRDLVYKLARYALWTSPFLALFAACRKELWALAMERRSTFLPATIFFGGFGFSYDVFMSSQGIVAYQQVPAAIGYFCLFSMITACLTGSGALGEKVVKLGAPLLLLFCFSYFVSVGRWQRFVRGIVEPRRAVVNLIRSGNQLTLFVPRGEIIGHIQELLKEYNPKSKVFAFGEKPGGHSPETVGRVFAFEFPIYMGDLPPELLAEVEMQVGGWASITDARTYRIYVGKRVSGESP